MLESEEVYVCLFARTGHWRIKVLPREVVAEGWKQRAIHKQKLTPCPCSGCVRMAAGFEVFLDFASVQHVQDTSMHTATKSVQDTTLDRLRAEKEAATKRKPRKPKKIS